jgi:hypothetical protein
MPRARSRAAEKEVVVPEGSNALMVRAGGHDWIAVVQGGAELVREASGSEETTFVLAPGTYTVRTDGEIQRADVREAAIAADPFAASGEEPLVLRLSADPPDRHAVDGIGEIPADGESAATITIDKLDATGEPLTRRRDRDEVFLRSTGGTIVDAQKNERVRSVKLKSGRASFRVVSEPTPRLVTVSAIGKGSPAPAEIQLEFV